MKLLVVSQYYYPEQFGVNDICSKLKSLGHEITVLTGLPNYPMGEIFEGYSWNDLKGQVYQPPHTSEGFRRDLNAHVSEVNGIKVIRCNLAPRRNGKKSLILNYLSFAVRASLIAQKITEVMPHERFDRILVTQYSPVTMAIPAIIVKRKLRIPLYLYCFDLWPESIVSAGLKNHGLVYSIIKLISKEIYKRADKIILSSRNFEKYLRSKLRIQVPFHYIPMYAEDVFTKQDAVQGSSSEVFACNLMFAGNIGKMQSIDTIIKACAKISGSAAGSPDISSSIPIVIHFVGNGSALEDSIEFSKEMGVFLNDAQQLAVSRGDYSGIRSGVIFHGRHPVEEMPRFYSIADAMLITLKKDEFISYTLPNKVQTYMAAAKPIIAAIDGEASAVIREASCGYVCGAEDDEALARNVLSFAEELKIGNQSVSGSSVSEYGKNARDYYEKHFSSDQFIKKLLQVLE